MAEKVLEMFHGVPFCEVKEGVSVSGILVMLMERT